MTIKSVDKAVAILDCFLAERQILSVREISRLTGFTKSNVSRLLSTMEKHGCVERAESFGSYQLGYRIHLWGIIASKQINLTTIARPVMENLRDDTGEEVVLYVIDGDRRLSIELVKSIHQIAKVDQVGRYYPLHAGAAGKILLAHLSKARRAEIYQSRPPVKITDCTTTEIEILEKELKKIRKQGFAVSRGEREPDAFSVNGPVRNASGEVVACLSLSGPCFRLTEDNLNKYIKQVKFAALEISKKLGCSAFS